MKLHANARTCPKSRRLLVSRVRDQGWSVMAAAEAAGISERSAYRWLRRFRGEGEAGLRDRSSAPKRIPHRTPAERVEAIEALRRLRMTGAEIAELLRMPLSTVSAWLKRIGLGRRSRLEPPEPPNRYELLRPGQLVHVDVKRLGRIEGGAGHRVTGRRRDTGRRTDAEGVRRLQIGWEFVHVMVDDHSRFAYAEVFQGRGENARQAVAFLRRGLAFFQGARRRGRARHVGQRRGLRLAGARDRPPRARRPPHPHPARSAAHQRQGRALHQGAARGMGLRRLYGSSAERERPLRPYLERYNF